MLTRGWDENNEVERFSVPGKQKFERRKAWQQMEHAKLYKLPPGLNDGFFNGSG